MAYSPQCAQISLNMAPLRLARRSVRTGKTVLLHIRLRSLASVTAMTCVKSFPLSRFDGPHLKVPWMRFCGSTRKSPTTSMTSTLIFGMHGQTRAALSEKHTDIRLGRSLTMQKATLTKWIASCTTFRTTRSAVVL